MQNASMQIRLKVGMYKHSHGFMAGLSNQMYESHHDMRQFNFSTTRSETNQNVHDQGAAEAEG